MDFLPKLKAASNKSERKVKNLWEPILDMKI